MVDEHTASREQLVDESMEFKEIRLAHEALDDLTTLVDEEGGRRELDIAPRPATTPVLSMATGERLRAMSARN